ncbi:hypothetical protein B0H66DRAFT_535434 [Apodospora peruviana]|uniref:Uncharacterized protein n=1 Tax=Apodospora peruviana TaxID=516989 RepID=A0AAE0HX72_9PEZI|nr:hypothetical protein B0H66DRAFT_535434 [Apodospora peruviana]
MAINLAQAANDQSTVASQIALLLFCADIMQGSNNMVTIYSHTSEPALIVVVVNQSTSASCEILLSRGAADNLVPSIVRQLFEQIWIILGMSPVATRRRLGRWLQAPPSPR